QPTPAVSPGGNATIWALRYGRSRKPLVLVVPDLTPPLYHVAWPDLGLSPAANLTRCKQAAMEWAENKTLTDLRKKHGVGALKLLENFSWSTSLVRSNDADPDHLPDHLNKRISEPAIRLRKIGGAR